MICVCLPPCGRRHLPEKGAVVPFYYWIRVTT
jgi:hypothetical protein